MPLTLSISPHGRLFIEEADDQAASPLAGAAGDRIRRALERDPAAGLLHLATVELQTALPPAFAYVRDLAPRLPDPAVSPARPGERCPPSRSFPPPPTEELGFLVLQAPPMKGLEYLSASVLAQWWTDLDQHLRQELRGWPGGVQAYLREKNPLWRLVGRVTFHLAENKRDEMHPFAFMATYANRLSAQNRLQHLPLARALQEYAGARDRQALVSLLTPIQRAAEKSALAKDLVDSGDVYHPLAWTPREAYRFLQDIPVFEEAGVIVACPTGGRPTARRARWSASRSATKRRASWAPMPCWISRSR